MKHVTFVRLSDKECFERRHNRAHLQRRNSCSSVSGGTITKYRHATSSLVVMLSEFSITMDLTDSNDTKNI